MIAKNKPSTLKNMSEAERAYIAGIIDGEGHLYIRAEYEGVSFGLARVRITDKCIVDYIKKTTGVGTMSSYQPNQRRKDGLEKRRIYEWSVGKRADIREFLKAIYPYLVLKKKRARLLLELEILKDQGINNGAEIARIRSFMSKETWHLRP